MAAGMEERLGCVSWSVCGTLLDTKGTSNMGLAECRTMQIERVRMVQECEGGWCKLIK